VLSVAVVTGAARGMGAACARSLGPEVDVLLLADRGPIEVPDLGPTRVESAAVDVADRQDVQGLAARAAALGELRWAVHAAGVSPTMGDARTMFEVDLVGSVHVVDAVAPHMAEGGAAVLFSSMAAHAAAVAASPEIDGVLADPLAEGAVERFVDLVGGDPGFAYAMAKRGVLQLARRAAVPWAGRGARINTVSPGSIETPMGLRELEGQPMMRTLLEQTPLARLGKPEEVVAAVRFLLSGSAAYVTGTDLLVDGGLVAAFTGTPGPPEPPQPD
jgi:NAD(P)-dependent dehydrogenase (short-subunit alcohol dehydrogenase family)